MKRYILTFAFSVLSLALQAQQYALFNTRTMFDSFENPAVKSFTLDSSSKWASNFFFPNFALNAANKGAANEPLANLINTGMYNTEGLPLGEGLRNKLLQSSNVYLATFRIFSSYKFNQEIGFAWQLRTEAQADYTNETLAMLHSYKHFSQGPYTNVFNSNGFQQSYHQFSVSLRENWNKKLAFGIKMSLLSGIAYNEVDINKSQFFLDAPNDKLDIGVTGSYKGSFLFKDEIDKKMLVPRFKNPGLAISIGTTYSSSSGYFLMANVKDLGFIRWNKKSYMANFDDTKRITDISRKSTNNITYEILDIAREIKEQQRFTTATNAKADFLISKTFDFYKPNLIISKNLFHFGGDIAFVNTFSQNNWSGSLSSTYNFNNLLMIGLQGMYKTPNFEFFLGTDNLGKSITLGKGTLNNNLSLNQDFLGGSVYMGLGIKFGKTVNHPLNMSTMPGVNRQKVYKGFFKSIYHFFVRPKAL